MISIKVASRAARYLLPFLEGCEGSVMSDGTDIRAQVVADNLLQDEINRGLAILAARLPADVDLRLVRILARVLESSWTEHVSFQHSVMFPIVACECFQRVRLGCCSCCGYNLTANTSGRCPECGTPIGAKPISPPAP